MLRKYSGFVLILVIAAIWGGYALTQSRSVGLCIGPCDAERHKEFRWKTTAWISDLAYCGKVSEQEAAMSELFPAIAAQINAANEEFTALAKKEKDGTLTLGEKDAYELSRLAVPDRRSVLDEVMGLSPEPDLIASCRESGFVMQSDGHSVARYCSGYVEISFAYAGNGDVWANQLERAYDRMKVEGHLETFISRITADLGRHGQAMRVAADKVNDMPLSTFDANSPAITKIQIDVATRNAACND